MAELWDIYDKDRRKTGKVVERGNYTFQENEYHIVVTGIIMNSKNEILIAQRAPDRRLPLLWECSGGSMVSGETSLQAMLRELKEELGLNFSKREAIFLCRKRRDESIMPRFKELWLFRTDISANEVQFKDNESVAAKWVTIDEFMDMFDKGEVVQTIDFGREDYEKAITLKPRESYEYIGENVDVKIDRPLNSNHPKHGFKYEVNYGYVPNTVSADGEELDCYVIGIDEPIEEFTGKCVAVIHRINDDDDKLIIVPEGKDFSDEEILTKINFQEKFFASEIIR